MFHQVLRNVIRITVVTGLFVTTLSAVSAQSGPEHDDAPPSVTETLIEAASPSDDTISDVTAAGVKTSTQSTEKAIPDESNVDPDVDAKQLVFLPLVAMANDNEVNSTVDAASILPPPKWHIIESETFEGNWPDAGWQVSDCNGVTGGVRYWDDESYKPYGGSWSAWPAGGGSNALNPRTSFYPNNACAHMTYGPFSLQWASAAKVTFNYWNQSERNYDWLSWMASCDGVNFYGTKVSGDSGGWKAQALNLANIPGLGSCLGDSTVWLRFRFISDSSITDDGPFVDNVVVWVYR